jgi:hypothetical protein
MDEDSKIVKSVGKRRPPAAGMGRKRGSLNKTTRTLKEALLASFNTLGGEKWLIRLAESDPKAYVGLLGRIIPSEINGQVRAISENLVVYIDTNDDDPEPVESATIQ